MAPLSDNTAPKHIELVAKNYQTTTNYALLGHFLIEKIVHLKVFKKNMKS